jgi:hypothetical protein
VKFHAALALALLGSTAAFAGVPDQKMVEAPFDDHWKFDLAVPGWMAGVEGTVGIDGIDSNIDLRFKGLINKIDMVWATRAEASKGRFGIMGELVYMSLSDSIGVGGPLRNVDVRLDQYLGDFGLRWRLIEGRRGFVDAIIGVRYTNLFQHLHLQGDDAGISQTSSNLVNDVEGLIRQHSNGELSEHEFSNEITDAVHAHVAAELSDILGPNPKRRLLAIGPLAARHPVVVANLIEDIIHEEEARLQKAIKAIPANAANRSAQMQKEIDAAEQRMTKRIASTLDKELNRSFSRGDDWWDPYVGVRARYNFTPAFYAIGRAEIGGFGVGSNLMWQLEGSLGLQITRCLYAEAGYRALSVDYDRGGLEYDTITHGAQVTVGVVF